MANSFVLCLTYLIFLRFKLVSYTYGISILYSIDNGCNVVKTYKVYTIVYIYSIKKGCIDYTDIFSYNCNMKLKQGKRPLCKCGNICTDSGNKTKNGFIIYKTICCSCKRAKYNLKSGNRKMGYTVHKKNECKLCGFIPVHSCQLDVDHIDGNKDNSDINNLQTLCANCHRLKTHLTKPCYNKKGAN